MIWKLWKGKKLVNTIVADADFAKMYSKEMGYTAELVEETETVIEEIIELTNDEK